MAIANFVTTEEAADIVGVTPGRIRQLVVEKRLKSQKVGPARLFDKKDVTDFAKIERKNGRPRAG